MHYKVYENVIPIEEIKRILNFFNTQDNLKVNINYMEKINNPWSLEVVKNLNPILSKYVDTSVNLGDNIYKHSYAYFPHTDTDPDYNSINALIPLCVESDLYQPFVIFDQYSKSKKPKTWVMQEDDNTNFVKNKAVTNSIYNDADVVGCMDTAIDEEFYKNYLKNNFRPRDLFYGLTGNVVDFKPGNLILFNSDHIHATGKMIAKYKIGLVLRFVGRLT